VEEYSGYGCNVMRIYVIEHIIGAIAVNEKGELITYKPVPKNLDDAVEEVLKLERGEIPYVIKQLVEELKSKEGIEKIIVEDENIAKFFNSEGFNVELVPGNPIAVNVRSNIGELAVKLGFVSSIEEYEKFMREAGIELTRRKLRRAAEKRDQLAIQAIRAVDDIDRTVNLFAARLREWYSLHFPELDELVREHEDYIRIVAELGHRENISKEKLVKLGFSEGKAEKIAEAARKSIGADLSDFDIKPIQTLASIALELYKLRGELTEYITAVMKEVAPNITALVGPLLGARLLSLAGGLDELARLPASTIQVLGAEKALFRALRTGGKPPKHGVIFQYPDIHRSPRWQRGKIARALAAKLAIAAKVDAFTGRYIGDVLVQQLRKRIEEIKKLYAKPPVRKKRVEEKAAPPRRRGPRRRRRGRRR